jgi:23S rRNA G2445 N2-methylase RlmL
MCGGGTFLLEAAQISLDIALASGVLLVLRSFEAFSVSMEENKG